MLKIPAHSICLGSYLIIFSIPDRDLIMLPDDYYLVKQMQEHDSQLAFTHLYKKYGRAVYALCYHYLCSAELAEDALQDIFFKIWDKRHTKDKNTPFRNFLFTIAKNHLLNILKSQRYHENVEDYINTIVDDPNDKEMKILKEGRLDDIQQAIQKLSPQKQKVVEMKLYNSSSNQEIANKLNVSINTVKSLYTSALHDLRRILTFLMFFV